MKDPKDSVGEEAAASPGIYSLWKLGEKRKEKKYIPCLNKTLYKQAARYQKPLGMEHSVSTLLFYPAQKHSEPLSYKVIY